MKRNGQRVPFNRDKLFSSIKVATRKRPVEDDWIDTTVDELVRHFETRGEPDVHSEEIGIAVMNALKDRDLVAFVRFASVYRDFSDAEDFENILREFADAGRRR